MHENQLATRNILQRVWESLTRTFRVRRPVGAVERVLHINEVAFVGSNLVLGLQAAGLHAALRNPAKPMAKLPFLFKIAGAWQRLRASREVLRFARAERFDLLHIHFVSTGLWYTFSGLPYVVHAHGSDVRHPWWKIDRHLINWLVIERACAVFYSTPDLGDVLKRYTDRAEFFPNPVNTEAFRPPAVAKRTRDIFIYAAFNPIKGASTLIEAARRVKARHPDVRIASFKLGSLIEDAHAAGIELVPFRPHAELPQALAEPGLLVGQVFVGAVGLSELEALSMGRTIICHFRYPEIYQEPPPFVQANTVEELVAAMEAYIEDPEVYREYDASARRWVIDNHDAITLGQRLARTYQGLDS